MIQKNNNDNNIDERTEKYRELMDQIIVEVKETSIEEHEEPFRGWFNKNHIILQDIEKLKKAKNERSKISAFLLESQYLEFEIIHLLQELQLLADTDPDVITFKGKRQSKELYELPLGVLHKELCKYNSDFLENLKVLVEDLNKKRIRFAHYLFISIKGIDEIIKEAKEGLAFNDKVFKELYSSFEYIKENTWYGQMYERKRVKEFSKKSV